MTLLPSPSSRSSSETSSPLDLDSGLTARLKAASIRPSIPDCAVLLDSAPVRVGFSSLLRSLAEEALVSSFTEGVSPRVGNGHDETQLKQPGKSISEDQPFIRRKDYDDSGFVSGSSLPDELIKGSEAPSVPLLSSSGSFSPSTFMDIDTRRGVSTFGGVDQFGANPRVYEVGVL